MERSQNLLFPFILLRKYAFKLFVKGSHKADFFSLNTKLQNTINNKLLLRYFFILRYIHICFSLKLFLFIKKLIYVIQKVIQSAYLNKLDKKFVDISRFPQQWLSLTILCCTVTTRLSIAMFHSSLTTR